MGSISLQLVLQHCCISNWKPLFNILPLFLPLLLGLSVFLSLISQFRNVVKGELINRTWTWDKQESNPWQEGQESNPWPLEHWADALSALSKNLCMCITPLFNWVLMWQVACILLGSGLSKANLKIRHLYALISIQDDFDSTDSSNMHLKYNFLISRIELLTCTHSFEEVVCSI